ncbi:MAG: Mur ligase family protein [Bacteroidota bacterium]
MRIHLIAIGGSAMHNLAIALHINHYTVSGSDDEIYNPARDRLAHHGLLPAQMGWDAGRIHADIDLIILGMHARPDNPELARARELNIPIQSYPEFLYNQAQHKTRVVVAGSHGKTTTTSMIMHVLQYHNQDYDYLVGAQLEGFDNMVRLSDAPLMVIEGDEYLSSALDRRPKMLHYRPQIAIITGIAWDHINVFPTFENYCEQFALFCQSMPAGAQLMYFAADEQLEAIVAQHGQHLDATGYRAFAAELKEGQTVLRRENGAPVPLSVFGQHNLANLRAAFLACRQLEISEEAFFEAIPSFRGAAKRLQLIKELPDSIAYLDFAHAPSKVEATIHALQEQYPQRQLLACLELHTFSSLNQKFLKEYREKMNKADQAIVFYSPHTLEMKRMPPISAQDIQTAFGHPNLQVITDKEALAAQLNQTDWTDRNLLLMSSGTFGGLHWSSFPHFT